MSVDIGLAKQIIPGWDGYTYPLASMLTIKTGPKEEADLGVTGGRLE